MRGVSLEQLRMDESEPALKCAAWVLSVRGVLLSRSMFSSVPFFHNTTHSGVIYCSFYFSLGDGKSPGRSKHKQLFLYLQNLSELNFSFEKITSKLSTMDLLVLASMKNAAKCDT